MAEILINFDDALIQFTAVGGETGFAYDFPIFDKTHLVVLRQATATATAVTMAEGTGYTVAGVGDEAGGSITFVTPASATLDEVYTLFRDVPEQRITDFTQTGSFTAVNINRELDLMAMQFQQLRRDVDRSTHIDIIDAGAIAGMVLPDKTTRASKFSAWDGNGDWIASSGSPPATVVVSTFMETLLDDIDAAAGRATLDVPGLTVVNTFTATQKWSKGADITPAAGVLTVGTDGNYFDVAAGAISSIATVGIGTKIKLHFDGVSLLTNNAVDFVLPGGEPTSRRRRATSSSSLNI